MSYSFVVRTPTKDEAKAKIAAEFDLIVGRQSVHAADRAQAQAAVFAFIDVLPDDPSKDVNVSCSGSLSGDWANGQLKTVTSVNLSIGANLLHRTPV